MPSEQKRDSTQECRPLPLLTSSVLPAPSHHGGAPSPCCSLCGPERMLLFISWTPLPFDSPLPSISADLCVLGIQLEARTERVTGARIPPQPLQARLLEPPRPAFLSCRALRWALWGLAAGGGGLFSADGTRSDAGECHIPVESGGGGSLLSTEFSI